MPLDLGETVLQLEQAVRRLGGSREDTRQRLLALIAAAGGVSPATAQRKTRYSPEIPFLAAQAEGQLLGAIPPGDLPADWTVAAVDGSHIDVDRHMPINCYLVNLGGCSITYGSRPDAKFFNQPHLAWEQEELFLPDPAGPAHEEPVTGPLLGMLRTVQELERLAQAAQDCPPEHPALALVDGSLVLWGLSGQGFRPFVRDAIIRDRLLVALDRIQELAQSRRLTLAAYVSLPRSAEVVNAVRLGLCPHASTVCRQSCGNRRSVQDPCNLANGFLDRDLFQETLTPGWRSPTYLTNSSVPREYYTEQHQVYFYYLNTGDEIARVEVPGWIAKDEGLLALGHTLILDQCQRGRGYPVAISEAHEQAVVDGRDRQTFKELVFQSLERADFSAYTSGKEQSKRTPWL